MENKKNLFQKIAEANGTPVFVIDLEKVRQNYREFTEKLPGVQVYFAIKANPDSEIIKTMYELGSSFDVASWPEFEKVYENIKNLPAQEQADFIYNKIIYANTIKPIETLEKLNRYKILVTFDNFEELKKIKKYAPQAGLILRIRVPNTGSLVELSSKFGADPNEAVALISQAINLGLSVEGISFHVGSQCNNFDNYLQALDLVAGIFREADSRGLKIKKIVDIGGGFPVRYTSDVQPLGELAKKLNSEIKQQFSKESQIIAEPGRFIVANACTLIVKIIGKSIRDGKTCYYVDDGVYNTFSGQVFDHQQYPLHSFKKGEPKICATFGPTCDAFDTISLADELPDNLEIGDLLYAENIGAYTTASASNFNGFSLAKVVYLNRH